MLSSFIHSYGLRTSYVAVSLTWPSPPKLQIHRHLYVLDTYVPRPCKPLIFSLFNPEPIVFLTKPSTACFLPGEIPLSIKTKIWTRPYIIFLTPNIKHYQIIAIFVHICVCVCVFPPDFNPLLSLWQSSNKFSQLSSRNLCSHYPRWMVSSMKLENMASSCSILSI